ncbi:hypothetical protein FIBSPDRAFT_71569 [Athelia psychrophila]|uniref:Uncharacterized protein n=1 Tax=Athelia psychrophila TaxID=1759441 RepID=A0A166TXK4_9AGAM|nr:hypothetical protein FIBSPDRAFT_71569 [Fibularhizoctonia sp. CBS 109695]
MTRSSPPKSPSVASIGCTSPLDILCYSIWKPMDMRTSLSRIYSPTRLPNASRATCREMNGARLADKKLCWMTKFLENDGLDGSDISSTLARTRQC